MLQRPVLLHARIWREIVNPIVCSGKLESKSAIKSQISHRSPQLSTSITLARRLLFSSAKNSFYRIRASRSFHATCIARNAEKEDAVREEGGMQGMWTTDDGTDHAKRVILFFEKRVFCILMLQRTRMPFSPGCSVFKTVYTVHEGHDIFQHTTIVAHQTFPEISPSLDDHLIP
jgi:hypothetical protein